MEPEIDDRVKDKLEKPIQDKNHFDPLSELTVEEEHECIKKALEQVNREHDKELSLAKSTYRTPGQEFLVVSFVGETLNQKTEEFGMKTWGAFSTIKEAQERAKAISRRAENKDFDVYVTEMYTWVKLPPDPKCMENKEYLDARLDKIIKTHKAQEMKKSQVFDMRKAKLTNNKDINLVKKGMNIDQNTEADANKEMMELICESEKLPKFTITTKKEAEEQQKLKDSESATAKE